MSENIVGERIRAFRKSRGWSGQELAKRINVAQTMISKYETGKKRPGFDTLTNLSKVSGYTVDYFLGLIDNPERPTTENNNSMAATTVGKTNENNDMREHKTDPGMSIKNIIPSSNLVWIPVISPEVRPSAGLGNNYANSDLGWEIIDRIPLFDGGLSALYSSDALVSMYVDGDSMEPQIHHGDLVVFNRCIDWVSGNIMVVCLDGRLMVKGLISKGGNKFPILRSTNKEYDDIQVDEDSFFVVYGRVLRIIRVSDPKPVI